MESKSVSAQTLRRLPLYLNYLKSLPKESTLNISATAIAEALSLNDVQVRKDLALISSGGRPKIGYVTGNLISDIEEFLGYDDSGSAVIVGAGNLGRAFLSFEGFKEYGIDIVAAFDTKGSVIGTTINGKQVFPAVKLTHLCRRMKIKLGIITVPPQDAQKVCHDLVNGGVSAIWNFAPVHLKVPENILVKNENLACSLRCFLHL